MIVGPPRRLLFLCNALDDVTRIERRITSDSPAASRKIFMLLQALRRPGISPYALSLGRGRRDGSARYHASTLRRAHGVDTIYLPFANRRIVSELVSLLAPVGVLWRLRRAAKRTTLMFYNRERFYLPALLAARLLGYRTVLDLEDGEVGLTSLSARARRWLFDQLCTGGALLACSALTAWTTLRPALSYYGIVETSDVARDWHAPSLGVLMGGTLIADTGVDLLAEAVEQVRAAGPAWAEALEIHVTGKGDGLATLQRLSASSVAPRIIVHGRTTDAEYAAILGRIHVGLALKLNSGPLAQTTFPSKVTEMAGAGVLVLTTDISDVRAVLGDGARYLDRDDAALLVAQLHAVVADRAAAAAAAARGLANVRKICAADGAGERLAAHLFGDPR